MLFPEEPAVGLVTGLMNWVLTEPAKNLVSSFRSVALLSFQR
jgi:hypothetical protein